MDAVSPETQAVTTRQQVFHVRGLPEVCGIGAAELPALIGVSFDQFTGEFAVLPGRSGNGETTLLNTI